MALIFGPKAHFYGVSCGKSEFDGGIIPFSKIHRLFCKYQTDLIPNETPNETKIVLSFFRTLGICRLLNPDEAHVLHFNPDKDDDDQDPVYEFSDLTQISELPFLPSDPENAETHRVLCILFENVTQYWFSQLRQKNLILLKDKNYKSFLNSVIVRRHVTNLELWFHKGERLYIIIRGPPENLQNSIDDINKTEIVQITHQNLEAANGVLDQQHVVPVSPKKRTSQRRSLVKPPKAAETVLHPHPLPSPKEKDEQQVLSPKKRLSQRYRPTIKPLWSSGQAPTSFAPPEKPLKYVFPFSQPVFCSSVKRNPPSIPHSTQLSPISSMS